MVKYKLTSYLPKPSAWPKFVQSIEVSYDDKDEIEEEAPPNFLRPRTFDEYIGQEEAKELAQIMVGAAVTERRHLPNIMVIGEYGLGKTSLARLIMGAAGLPERLYDGSSVNKKVPESGTFIIDEIHNLTSEVADSLNIKLDNGTHHIIGCTNEPGILPSAFRSRFQTLHLQPYRAVDLRSIIEKACDRKGTVYKSDATELIATRSRFNARQALSYLSFILDMMVVNNHNTLDRKIVLSAFEKRGVDERGLLPRDKRYLDALHYDQPVGLQYLSAVLGMDVKTLEEEVEPFLMRMGFVNRTSRGRIRIVGSK